MNSAVGVVFELFRRVVFNAALGNTDDHLKNFWMLHDKRGWALSPAFDLLPDTGRRCQHTLALDADADPPDRRTLLMLGVRWGVRNAGAIIDKLVIAVAQFADTAKACGVADEDIERFNGDIAARCRALDPA